MTSVNARLRDAEVDHAVDLEQYKTGVVRRLIGLLNRTDADLFAQITAAIDGLSAEALERLESLLGSVRMLNLQAYQALGRDLTDELRRFTEHETGYQLGLFQATVPPQIAVSLQRVDPGQVYAAAYAQPFRGRLLREWSESIEADRMARIRDAIRIGVVENQTTQQIMTRLRGTRARGYADGLIEIDRRAAEAVVRTAVSHVAGFARDRFHAANGDLLKATAWASTLDARTTEPCRIRDGKQYHPVTHAPIGHKVPWLSGPGRLHWRCRSSSVPVTKSWRELGIDMDEMPAGDRASMDGAVPAEQLYGEWLRKQPAKRQDQIVGPTRGKLMREGKMPFDSLYTNRGEWLTLEQLKDRNAEAFRKAGV